MWAAFPRKWAEGTAMRWDTIARARPAVVRVNMADDERARAEFSGPQPMAQPDGLRAGGLDIGHAAAGRPAGGDRADAVALRCAGGGGEVTECSHGDLRWKTNRSGAQIGARHG
jgi:hypothetical protein